MSATRARGGPRVGWPDPGQPVGGDCRATRLAVAVIGVLAAAPVMVGVIRAVAWGWTPAGDEGVIAARAFDVLTAHPPLVGQYSQASILIGEPTYSLGPLLYWLLALPAHAGPWALVVAMGAVNVAVVLATVTLAHRRGGLPLALAVGLGLVLMIRSLPSEAVYAVWNPYAPLLPFTLLLFVAWSVAVGEHRLLPLLALLASFVVQAHLTYLLPGLGAVAGAVAGATITGRREGRRWSNPDVRRWVLAAAVVALVCWSGPLVEQALHRPGNLMLVARSAVSDRPTLGVRAGGNAVIRAVGIPPWWLQDRDSTAAPLAELVDAPAPSAIVSAVIVVAGLVVVLVAAIRRRRREVTAATALGLWLCASLGLAVSSSPTAESGVETFAYSVIWTYPAGLWIWLMTAWGALVLVAGGRRISWAGHRALALAGVSALALVGLWAIWDHRRENAGLSTVGDFAAAAERVTEAIPGAGTVLVDAPEGTTGRLFLPSIAYALRRAGTRVLAPPEYATYLGDRYQASGERYSYGVRIDEPGNSAGADARPIARLPLVSLAIVRGPGGRTATP